MGETCVVPIEPVQGIIAEALLVGARLLIIVVGLTTSWVLGGSIVVVVGLGTGIVGLGTSWGLLLGRRVGHLLLLQLIRL